MNAVEQAEEIARAYPSDLEQLRAGADFYAMLFLVGLVFGAAFAASQPYLVAGFAAAVLFFIDQFVQIAITANNRPGLLAVKWAVASAVAFATLVFGTPLIGAYAGPAGIALGLVAGWFVVLLRPRRSPAA